VRGGDLWFRGFKVAIVYFRAGYAPEHYPNPTAWRSRSLIESSSAISVPAAATQLANTKKIQQVLSRRSLLEQFVQGETAERLHRSMVAFSPLDEEIEWQGQRGPAREVAAAHPADWVLKPYREGGGNNLFDEEMVGRLKTMTAEESRAFILMERIKQPPFHGVRLVLNEVVEGPCVTELGFFGNSLFGAGAAEPEFNEHCGYLLRTKDEANAEGLVLGGYSFLDSAVV
jgi:glutathione synthase